MQKKNQGMTPLDKAGNWEDLNNAEELDLYFNKVVKVDEVLENHPWLKVCESVAEQQGFFHWELDFATVFARGGFDLQLGNPPWVRPRYGHGRSTRRGRPLVAAGPQSQARPLETPSAKRHLRFPGIRASCLERQPQT